MEKERDVVLELMSAIVDSVRAGTKANPAIGVPGGHLYAALMDMLNLDQFERIMGTLISVGLVTKRGQCYFSVAKATQ